MAAAWSVGWDGRVDRWMAEIVPAKYDELPARCIDFVPAQLTAVAAVAADIARVQQIVKFSLTLGQ